MNLTSFQEDSLAHTIEKGAYDTVRLSNGRKISCIKLSPDCEYIAIGDVAGVVTIRRLGKNGRKLVAFDAGPDTAVLHIVWHPSPTQRETLFVCSGNGFINCINFKNVDDESPVMTGVRFLGWASAMAVNDSGTQLSVSHDDSTKMHTIPFEERNYRLPVVFLTENTVAAGHNYGYVVTASRGMDQVVRMGKRHSHPSQVLSGALNLQKNEMLIASAHDTELLIRVFGPRPQPSQQNQTPQENILSNHAISSPSSAQLLEESNQATTSRSAQEKGKAKEEPLTETQLIPPPDPQASSSIGSSQATLVGEISFGSTSISASSSKLPAKEETQRTIKKEDNENPPDRLPRFGTTGQYIPNTKKGAIIVALLLLFFLILRSSFPSQGSDGHLQQFQPAPRYPAHNEEGGYFNDDEDDDVDGCACEDPILITETKVVTVTKAVTTTITVEKPRRTAKGRHKRTVASTRFVWPILKALPWASNTILLSTRPLVELADAFVKPLASRMDALETYLRHNHTTQDAVKLAELLHQESLEDLTTGRHRQEDHNNFAYMMTSYRVIAAYSPAAGDAEASVEPQRIDAPDSFKESFCHIYKKYYLHDRLSNWPESLIRSAGSAALVHNHMKGSSDGAPDDPFTAIRNWSKIKQLTGGLNVAENLLVISLHLSFLLNGSYTVSSGDKNLQIPNIPSSEDAILKESERHAGKSMSHKDKKFIHEIISNYSIVNLRFPLYFGSHSSIVVALLGVKLLSKKGVSKATINSLPAFLGARKPPALKETEKIVWGLVRGLTQSCQSLLTDVHSAFQSLPWDVICSSSTQDRTWLDPGFSIPELLKPPAHLSSLNATAVTTQSPVMYPAVDQSKTANTTSDRKRKREPNEDDEPASSVDEPQQQFSPNPSSRTESQTTNTNQTSRPLDATALAPQPVPLNGPADKSKTSRNKPRRKRNRKRILNEDTDDEEPTSPVVKPHQESPTNPSSNIYPARESPRIPPIKVPPVANQGQNRRTSNHMVKEESGGSIEQSDKESSRQTNSSPNTTLRIADHDAAAMWNHQNDIQGSGQVDIQDSWANSDPCRSSSSPAPPTFSYLNSEGSEVKAKYLSMPPDFTAGWRAPSILGAAGTDSTIPIDVDALDRYRSSLHPVQDSVALEESEFDITTFDATGGGPVIWIQYHLIEDIARPDHLIRLDAFESHVGNGEYEAVVLKAGQLLALPPGSLYLLYAHKDVVIHRRYFYSSATMRETHMSLVQSFVLGNLIAKDVGTLVTSRHYLCRMMIFWHDALTNEDSLRDSSLPESLTNQILNHVPVIDSFDSCLNVLSLVCICVFANVYDRRTYGGEGIPPVDRALYIAARRSAIMTARWLIAHYDFIEPGTGRIADGKKEIWFLMMTLHAKALLRFKRAADRSRSDFATSCTEAELHAQLKCALGPFPDAKEGFENTLQHPSNPNLDLNAPLTWLTSTPAMTYDIRRRPEPFTALEDDEIWESPGLGYTVDDLMFFQKPGSHSYFL
ncbi:hypothetical protein EST38_g9218 [Candolleomyces aberdarensis]|uniref:Uncharacterized protein n=1 Tax=Candolleomyces aberdarensis TaxID=2316362 RepID=A0A4Q2DDQ6_9AGAR|nr:hypothetical protein EST38_g9218 [Candolleomyces aberdarensis]